MAQRTTERVIVFIDWQNVYRGARDAFHNRQAPGRTGMVWCHYPRVDDYRGMVDPSDYTMP